MKTSELTGAALDWAVAKCEGRTLQHEPMGPQSGHGWWICEEVPSGRGGVILSKCIYVAVGVDYSPSTSWAQGGPIIDAHDIDVLRFSSEKFSARKGRMMKHPMRDCLTYHLQQGPTKLIAAMRCFVDLKLGDEVDIPKELL